MLGPWGKRKLREMILGRAPAKLPPAIKKFSEFMALIQQSFRPRKVKLPIFSDEALERLTMPVLAIVGGCDVLLDSGETPKFAIYRRHVISSPAKRPRSLSFC
jgi:hypothetical protein